MPRLLALAIENYDSPIAGVRTRIAPKWLSALPIPPKKKLYDMRLESGEWTAALYQKGVEVAVLTEFSKELQERIAELEIRT